MRDLRWKCEEKGCYRKLMPKLGAFDGCFPGKIGMSDVDGVVEIAGSFLFLEWKAPGGSLTTGQKILFERLTCHPRVKVIVVSGEPREMTVETIQVFEKGRGKKVEKADFDGLWSRVAEWSRNAALRRVRPSRRAA